MAGEGSRLYASSSLMSRLEAIAIGPYPIRGLSRKRVQDVCEAWGKLKMMFGRPRLRTLLVTEHPLVHQRFNTSLQTGFNRMFPYLRSSIICIFYNSSCPPLSPGFSAIRMIFTTKLVHPVKCLVLWPWPVSGLYCSQANPVSFHDLYTVSTKFLRRLVYSFVACFWWGPFCCAVF